MKKLFIAAGVVFAVLLVAILAAPFVVPKDTIRDQVVAQVKAATGRDLVIGGDLGISVFPTAGVRIDRVAFANAAGATHKDMVTLSQLKVDVELIPLLSGNIAINSFVLVEPVIRLEVDRQGRANWDFGDGTANAPAPAPAAGGTASRGASNGGSFLNELRLGDVRIQNGTLYFSMPARAVPNRWTRSTCRSSCRTSTAALSARAAGSGTTRPSISISRSKSRVPCSARRRPMPGSRCRQSPSLCPSPAR